MLRTISINTEFFPEILLRNFLPGFKHQYPISQSKNVFYYIPYKQYISNYIGETGSTFEIRMKEHEYALKTENLISKLVVHSLDIDHIPDFSNFTTIKLNCNYKYKKSHFSRDTVCKIIYFSFERSGLNHIRKRSTITLTSFRKGFDMFNFVKCLNFIIYHYNILLY